MGKPPGYAGGGAKSLFSSVLQTPLGNFPSGRMQLERSWDDDQYAKQSP